MVGFKATMLHHIIALFNSKEAVLALILLQLLSSTLGVINFVPNVTVSTVDGVSFSYYISDMKPHPSDPNSLLLIVYQALLSLNILTKQTSTVVGVVSSRGYVEGVGESARFTDPQSFIIKAENKIIVSDTWNHCLREVDLSSRQTSRLAGTCQSRGYTNGAALQAQFFSQMGLLQYNTDILVADRKNSAIRRLSGGVVSTLVEGSPVQSAYYFTQIEYTVYVSTGTGVVKLDPDSASVRLIAGDASSSGYSDGPLLYARFCQVYNLKSLSPDLILLADQSNRILRLVDLRNQIVTSICTGTHESVDGASDRCQLTLPWSIAVLNGTIYVGDNQKIRTIHLNSIVKKDTEPAVGRSVLLQVTYPTQCDQLYDISYMLIAAYLKQLFGGLTTSCQECQLSGDQPVDIHCKSGLLTANWKTNLAIDDESGRIPTDTETSVLNRLSSIQNTNLNIDGHYFQITILTRLPLTRVSPVMNANGLYLRLNVLAVCPLAQMVYDDVDDACYIPE